LTLFTSEKTPVFTGALHLQHGIRHSGVSGCFKHYDNVSQHWPLDNLAANVVFVWPHTWCT